MKIYRVRVDESNIYEKHFETLEGALNYLYNDFIKELNNCSIKFENYNNMGVFEFTLLYDTEEEESFWKNRKIFIECIKVYTNEEIEKEV